MTARKQTPKTLPKEEQTKPTEEETKKVNPVVEQEQEPDSLERLCCNATSTLVGSIDEQPEAIPQSPWERVDLLSDDEMSIEAVNINAYQRNAMLLRVRVNGSLTGKIIMVDRMQFKSHDGTFKSK